MTKKGRGPAMGERVELRDVLGKRVRGPWSETAGRAWMLLFLWLQAACATSTSSEKPMREGRSGERPPASWVYPDTKVRGAATPLAAITRQVPADAPHRDVPSEESSGPQGRQDHRTGESAPFGDEQGEGMGWPDGVGDGRPGAVPMSLDYFQGFLVQAGVPSTSLPEDGRTLSSEQALELLPHLLSTPVTLGNFGPRRMAAHLLLEVATGGAPVSRDELHARMRRFSRLLVVRPDGYLVKPATGEAVQKAGEVGLADDGTLRAGRFEVGPFYAVQGGFLFPVDVRLEVPRGAPPVSRYTPDNGVLLPLAEGAALAVVDSLEGLYRLVFSPKATLEGLTQLPGAMRQLYANAPQFWEEFRHKPSAERVRTVSRLTTGVLLMMGTTGAGAAKAASWGGSLGEFALPVFFLSGDGLLSLRLVAVPVGGAVAVAGGAVSATYVLHMANVGAQGAGGAWPPVGGPGRWVEDTASMSDQARDYQALVTGAPKGWKYRVCRGGDCVDYDGYDSKTSTLLEAKAREYDKWFDADLKPKWGYTGLSGLVGQARRQAQMAGGLHLRWHIAEPRMVVILQNAFKAERINGIEVVYTPP